MLVVGGGPAGLECARVLVERGHKVTLADAGQEFGGRLRFETKLPGLSTWSRVLDYRLAALRVAAQAELFLDSHLMAEDVFAFGCDRVVIATGSRWTRMLYAPSELPMAGIDHPAVFTPDDIAAGVRPEGPVIVFDFDNYAMGGAIAELLAQDGTEVRYVTPAGHVSAWSFMTNELPLIHRAVRARQVTVDTLETVAGFDGERLTLRHLFTADERSVPCRSLVVVAGCASHNRRALSGAHRRPRGAGSGRYPRRGADRRRVGARGAGPCRPFRPCLWPRIRRRAAVSCRDRPIVSAAELDTL